VDNGLKFLNVNITIFCRRYTSFFIITDFYSIYQNVCSSCFWNKFPSPVLWIKCCFNLYCNLYSYYFACHYFLRNLRGGGTRQYVIMSLLKQARIIDWIRWHSVSQFVYDILSTATVANISKKPLQDIETVPSQPYIK